MKVSEEFRKEALGTHIGLATAFAITLILTSVALISEGIRWSGFLLLPIFFLVILVHCYLHDKKTHKEMVEGEGKEE